MLIHEIVLLPHLPGLVIAFGYVAPFSGTLYEITFPLVFANLIAGAILYFSFAMLEVSDSQQWLGCRGLCSAGRSRTFVAKITGGEV